MTPPKNEATGGVIVATSGRTPGAALAAALASAGQRVIWLHDGPADARAEAAEARCVRFDDAAVLSQAFAAARTSLGGLSHVLISAMDAYALGTGEVAGMDFSAWSAVSQGSTKAVLRALQAGMASMPEGGVITLVGPNIGLVGAEKLVPLCVSLEGQRSLAKSAARQWGGRGIRINWVGMTPRVYDAGFAELSLPQVPELGPPPPALGRPITLADDVVPVIQFLGSPQARALTGHMFNIDGGDWMLP